MTSKTVNQSSSSFSTQDDYEDCISNISNLVVRNIMSQFNSWGELDGYYWTILLAHEPQFADRCDFSELTSHNILDLLHSQPQFADRCNLTLLDGWDWVHLLINHSQLYTKCDWCLLDYDDWRKLLKYQPHLVKYRNPLCP